MELSKRKRFSISISPVCSLHFIVVYWERKLANNCHPADVEQIEHRRPSNPDMDALYILSPESWIVDCLMADFEMRRYRKAYLVWTSCMWAATPEASQTAS